MSTLLAALGAAAARRPWRVVVAWVLVAGTAIGLGVAYGGKPHDVYTIPGAQSQTAFELLVARWPEQSGTDARVVVHDRGGQRLDPAALAELGRRLGTVDGVSSVPPPRVSASGATALFSLQYRIDVTEMAGTSGVDALRAATADAERAGLQVELGGQVPENFTAPGGLAETLGLAAALIILVLAFGNLLAAGLPVAVALVGLGTGMSLVQLLAAVTDVSTTAPTIATMIGIGIGVDYALLLLTRFAEGLREGLDVQDAVRTANATAGTSVVFAGTTVLASLLGLRFAGLPIYASYGTTTLLVTLVVMITSVTLVPALCSLAGYRVLRRRARRAALAAREAREAGRPAPEAAPGRRPRPSLTRRWARLVGRVPLLWMIVALAAMLALAAPALQMRTWPQDAGSQPESNTTRRAYDLVSSEFGPGANGPLAVVVDLTKVPADFLPQLRQELAGVPGVAEVGPPVVHEPGHVAIIGAQPTTGPQDAATRALVQRIRSDLPGGAYLAGITSAYADVADVLDSHLAVVVGFVVAFALLILTMVFRSIVVAVKAALMNLLSVAAAYGVMVMVFQWGYGAAVLGLPHAVPVSSYVPILMFAALFGLSMDYEVFLLSRVRERWLVTGDGQGSVVEGLAATGRVITSAAAIMVSVFAAFALDADVVVKMTGVGMATAVLLDASIVRMVLVPSTMALLGRANWWLPRWLDRILPHLDVEGRAPVPASAAPGDPATPAPSGAPASPPSPYRGVPAVPAPGPPPSPYGGVPVAPPSPYGGIPVAPPSPYGGIPAVPAPGLPPSPYGGLPMAPPPGVPAEDASRSGGPRNATGEPERPPQPFPSPYGTADERP